MNKGICAVLLICFGLAATSCATLENALAGNKIRGKQTADKNTADFSAAGLTEEKLELAVARAVKAQGNGYYRGECITEGHIILGAEDDAGGVKVYTLASVGWFGFENGIFTKISGSGAIPAVITFAKNERGEYALLEYREPLDGIAFNDSVKKLFPGKLRDKALHAGDSYPELAGQQEIQAAAYLKSIGRTAGVSADWVEKQQAQIDVQASNKLFGELTQYDVFLNNCPHWLGTRERIEDGVRYSYETAQSKADDGCDLIIFRKIRQDGSLMEERRYKIAGSEPQLVN